LPPLVGAQHAALQGSAQLPLANPANYPISISALARDLRRCRSCGSGRASFAWLTAAAELVERGQCHALTTAPIGPKQAWHAAGHAYPGPGTKRLAELSDKRESSHAVHRPLAPTEPGDSNNPCWPPPQTSPLARCPAARPALVESGKLECFAALLAGRFVPKTPARGRRAHPHCGEKADCSAARSMDWADSSCMEALRRSHPEVKLIGPCQPDTCCWVLPPPAR